MESETNFKNDQLVPPRPTCLSNNNNNMKFEILDDDFCIDSFENLDDHFPLPVPYSSYINGIELDGYDPFDPFVHGSSSGFDFYEFKPCYEDTKGLDNVQSFQSGEFLNFPNKNDMLMDRIGTVMNCHDSKPLNIVVPDEGSCVTAKNNVIDCHKKNNMKRNKNIAHNDSSSSSNSNNNNIESATTTTKKSARGQKKPKSAKGQWTLEEDKLLIHLVEKHGVRKWSQIAQMLKGRIGKQCRERWHNHLRPDIKKDLWTEEEDRILIETHAQVGNKWAEIAKRLPGRTENSIKNHWNATKRRQFSRRKCRTKWPKPSSLLQNYIRSLNLERGSNSYSRSRNVTAPLPNANPGIINSPSNDVPEGDFNPANDILPDFTFDEFAFDDDDDNVFVGSSMDVFMNDVQNNEAGFNVELPFDMPPLIQ